MDPTARIRTLDRLVEEAGICDPAAWGAVKERAAQQPERIAELAVREGLLDSEVVTLVDAYHAEVPARPGETPPIEGFRILGVLGRGAMGVVLDAVQDGLERRVALKILQAGSAARFEREASLSARIDHPNVVRIYKAGHSGGNAYIAMERVDGESLAEVAERQRLSWRDAARVAKGVARGLAALAEKGIVHRDIKPSNILLEASDTGRPEAGRVLLTDFGLARRPEDAALTATGELVGTPLFLPPERVGDPTVGPASAGDLWALGVTLYWLLTGTYPFGTPPRELLLAAILYWDPVPPARVRSGIPRDLETIVLTLLDKDPSRRYPSAQRLAEDLDRLLDGRPVLASRPGVCRRLAGRIRRRPARSAALLLVAGAVLGLVGWALAIPLARSRDDARQRERLARAAANSLEEGEPEKAIESLERALEFGIDPELVGALDAARAESITNRARRLLANDAADRASREEARALLDEARGLARPDRSWREAEAFLDGKTSIEVSGPEGELELFLSQGANFAGSRIARIECPIRLDEIPFGSYRLVYRTPGGATRLVRLALAPLSKGAGLCRSLDLATLVVGPPEGRSDRPIARALERARPGERIRLSPGRYAEPVLIEGLAACELAGSPGTVLAPSNGSSALRIASSPGFVVRDLAIEAANGIQIVDSPEAAIAGVTIAGSAIGIDVRESPGVLIEQVDIRGAAHGIHVERSDGAAVRLSRIEGAVGNGIGILDGSSALVEGNLIVGVGRAFLRTRRVGDLAIRSNLLFHSRAKGVHVSLGGRVSCVANRIAQVRESGFRVEAGTLDLEVNAILYCEIAFEFGPPPKSARNNLMYACDDGGYWQEEGTTRARLSPEEFAKRLDTVGEGNLVADPGFAADLGDPFRRTVERSDFDPRPDGPLARLAASVPKSEAPAPWIDRMPSPPSGSNR